MRIMKSLAAFAFVTFCWAPETLAADQVAVVTRTEGDVQLLMDPASPGAQENTTKVAFEGETYAMRPAKIGDRLRRGNVIQVGDGKARLIYQNGDQITVAHATAYKVTWDEKKEEKPIMQLFYGKVRALVQKEGPRAGLEVKTKTAVMGVRGTDFHVAAWAKNGGTEVDVLRGKIAVAKAAESPTAKQPAPVEVPAGESATVAAAKPATSPGAKNAPAPEIKVQQTSKEQLVLIQHASKVAPPKPGKGEDAAISALEKQAVTTVMEDIKKEDPALYKSLEANGKPVSDTDEIQTKTVKKLFVTAPSKAPEGKGAKPQDLDTDSKAYDKYEWEGDE